MRQSSSQYTCVCGVHVKNYVLFWSISSTIFSFLGVVLFVTFDLAPFALLLLIQLAISVLVVCGNRYSIPCFYLPSLFFQILGAMIFIGFSVGAVGYGCYLTVFEFTPTLQSEEKTLAIGMGLLVILFGLIILCVSLFNAYLVEAFYRGYLYTTREQNIRSKNPPVMFLDP